MSSLLRGAGVFRAELQVGFAVRNCRSDGLSPRLAGFVGGHSTKIGLQVRN